MFPGGIEIEYYTEIGSVIGWQILSQRRYDAQKFNQNVEKLVLYKRTRVSYKIIFIIIIIINY